MMRRFLMATGVVILSVAAGCVHETTEAWSADEPARPLVAPGVVFEEVDGVVAVEAEDFFAHSRTEVRAWRRTTAERAPTIEMDADEPHVEGASGGAYLEILPDTRQTPDDELIREENFTEAPGTIAVLSYKVHVNTPGRYYVWARIYSTGADDNGLHVGLDGAWPDSGKRMQWIAKRRWVWGSKQRTAVVHTGVKHKIYLDIREQGVHEISFSMREDGIEFDKWLMTLEKLDGIDGVGPEPRLKRGQS